MNEVLPCQGKEALYDIVLFGEGGPAEREQAVHQAAALCGSCPAPCELKVTVGICPERKCPSYRGYLAHKKRGEDACEGSKAAKRVYDRARYAKDPVKARAPQRAYEARNRFPLVVPERIALMAGMAAELAADGRTDEEVAAGLCVSEEVAVELIAMARRPLLVLERAA